MVSTESFLPPLGRGSPPRGARQQAKRRIADVRQKERVALSQGQGRGRRIGETVPQTVLGTEIVTREEPHQQYFLWAKYFWD